MYVILISRCAPRKAQVSHGRRDALPRSISRFSSLFFFPFLSILSSMRASALRIARRGLATAAAHPPHASPSSSHVTPAASAIPLSNVEAQWGTLSPSEQTAVHQQLEELQRKDWKTLSLGEKKAGASVCPDYYSLHRGSESVRACSCGPSSLLCCVWPAWATCTG